MNINKFVLLIGQTQKKCLPLDSFKKDVTFVNIGHEIASKIKDINHPHLPSMVCDWVDTIIEENKSTSIDIGRDFVALKNIGILFEPQLEFNFQNMINNKCREILLLLLVEGNIKNDILYLGCSQDQNYSISVKNYSIYNDTNNEIQ